MSKELHPCRVRVPPRNDVAVQDLKEAAGQFLLYELALRQSETESDRSLFLAVREAVYNSVFVEGVGKLFLNNNSLRLIVFDPDEEEILLWIK